MFVLHRYKWRNFTQRYGVCYFNSMCLNSSSGSGGCQRYLGTMSWRCAGSEFLKCLRNKIVIWVFFWSTFKINTAPTQVRLFKAEGFKQRAFTHLTEPWSCCCGRLSRQACGEHVAYVASLTCTPGSIPLLCAPELQ